MVFVLARCLLQQGRVIFKLQKEKKMRKTLGKAALAALGLTMVAGSASAIEVDMYVDETGPTAGPALLANEAYSTTAGIPANAINSVGPAVFGVGDLQGALVITTGVNSPTRIEMTLDNGEFVAASTGQYNLFAWDDADNDGVIDDGELGQALEGSTGNVVDGVVAGDTITWVGPLSHFDGGLLAAGTRVVALDSDDGGAPAAGGNELGLDFLVNDGLAQNDVINVTVTEGNPFGPDNSATTAFAQLANQFVLCVDAPPQVFDAVIDIEAANGPRTAFTAGANDDVSQYRFIDRNGNDTSVVGLSCGDSTDLRAHYYATADDDGAVAVVQGHLSSSQDDQAVATMDLAALGDVDADANIAFSAADDAWVTAPDNNVASANANEVYEFTATVDGTAINTRTFNFEIRSTPAAGFFEMVYTTTGEGQWTLGAGYSSIITYFPLNFSGYNAFIQATNRSAEDAPVTLAGTCLNTVTNVQLQANGNVGTVGSNEHVTFTSADVLTALGLDADTTYQCAIEVMSEAPGTLFQIAGIQIGPDGRTMLPVYNMDDLTEQLNQ